jgi:hypothetical protein
VSSTSVSRSEESYGFGELDELVLDYTTTIHKVQGSEYRIVVIPLTTEHHAALARTLLYTGLTRSKRLVVLLGQPWALPIAMKDRNSCTARAVRIPSSAITSAARRCQLASSGTSPPALRSLATFPFRAGDDAEQGWPQLPAAQARQTRNDRAPRAHSSVDAA